MAQSPQPAVERLLKDGLNRGGGRKHAGATRHATWSGHWLRLPEGVSNLAAWPKAAGTPELGREVPAHGWEL